MRLSGTLLLLILPLVLAGGPAAHARILGGGPKAADCFLYFDGIDAVAGKKFVVECKDNDTCDFDTIAQQCTFRFTACTGAADAPPCTPADVTAFKGHGVQNLPPLGPAACATEPSDVVVKLKRSKRVNKRTIKVSAITATGKPKRDLDTLVLKCIASPSGAFVFE